MTPASTVETKRLAEVDAAIERLVESGPPEYRSEFRLQVLEAVASRIAGFDLEDFQARFSRKPVAEVDFLIDESRSIVQYIDDCGIHPALAISALAREALDESSRRRRGAYHTDFRLALHLAGSVQDRIEPGMRVIDPACGAGILLAAISAVACGSDRILASEWIEFSVYAADLTPAALRGTLISLSTFTDNLNSIEAMARKWRLQDSLLASDGDWLKLVSDGFDLVVANPPWEKVKLSRHEYSKEIGESRHYGESYRKGSLVGYDAAKLARAKQAALLVARYPALSAGEPDLYVAFTELLLNLTRAGGSGAIFVPGGLIRSLNTQCVREDLVGACKKLTFTVMENRARHFAIDTRFKFVFVDYVKAGDCGTACKNAKIIHAKSDKNAVFTLPAVNIPISTLSKLRPDLTVPEVRTAAEWRLFKKMQDGGSPAECPDSPWYPEFCREVDMTRDRVHFKKATALNCIPLIEGRMVQPHRLGCKSHVTGEGRGAEWVHLPPGASKLCPQFCIKLEDLNSKVRERTERARAGFCDITGQTNERSMMAALVPSGTVCGNKVPTIEFPNDDSLERIFLWLGIVNSFPFDWLLRRIVTTTVNYFLLTSLRLPAIEIDSLPARRIIEISKLLNQLDSQGGTSFELCWRIARLRAEVDVLVCKAYGCEKEDLVLMLEDFSLIDRWQPCLEGERRSTVTSDLLMCEWDRRGRDAKLSESGRLKAARESGAIPYLSSEFFPSVLEMQEIVSERK